LTDPGAPNSEIVSLQQIVGPKHAGNRTSDEIYLTPRHNVRLAQKRNAIVRVAIGATPQHAAQAEIRRCRTSGAHFIAVESFLFDFEVGPQEQLGRQFFDCKSECICGAVKSSISAELTIEFSGFEPEIAQPRLPSRTASRQRKSIQPFQHASCVLAPLTEPQTPKKLPVPFDRAANNHVVLSCCGRAGQPQIERAVLSTHQREQLLQREDTAHEKNVEGCVSYSLSAEPEGGTLSGERQVKKIIRSHACGELQPAEPTQRVSRNWRDGLHYLCRGA